jgi:hypothetical protein
MIVSYCIVRTFLHHIPFKFKILCSFSYEIVCFSDLTGTGTFVCYHILAMLPAAAILCIV